VLNWQNQKKKKAQSERVEWACNRARGVPHNNKRYKKVINFVLS